LWIIVVKVAAKGVWIEVQRNGHTARFNGDHFARLMYLGNDIFAIHFLFFLG